MRYQEHWYSHGYFDPTAGAAISRVTREEELRGKRAVKAERAVAGVGPKTPILVYKKAWPLVRPT